MRRSILAVVAGGALFVAPASTMAQGAPLRHDNCRAQAPLPLEQMLRRLLLARQVHE